MASCAFCTTPMFRIPFPSTPLIATAGLRRTSTVMFASTVTLKRGLVTNLPRFRSERSMRRRRGTTLVGMYRNSNSNDNGRGPNNRFNNGRRGGGGGGGQAAELLQTAGRFLQSPSGQVVLWAGLVWLVVTGRIGIIFDSFLFLFAFVTIVPVVAVLAFRWWLSRQLVQGHCPSCGATVTGLKGQSFPCTVCGNTVQGEPSGRFSVKDPASATIDIDATEVEDI